MCVQPPQVCNDGDVGGTGQAFDPMKWLVSTKNCGDGQFLCHTWDLLISLPKKKNSQPPETLVSMMACNGLIYIFGSFSSNAGDYGG